MAFIWGANYTIVKSAFADLEPQAFNALRMSGASLVMLAAMRAMRGAKDTFGVFHTPARVTPREWVQLAALGAVGHCAYQYCFVGGLARTSVANSSLLIAMTPVLIAIMIAAGGHRVPPAHWAGTTLSLAGIYVVLGHGARFGGASLRGDVMVGIAVVCWAVYTLGSRGLMRRHSALGVTGLSMALGTAMYVPIAAGSLLRVRWDAVHARTWLALAYSALFALCVAYTIWYAAVKRIGSARTSVYSNVVPIVAMAAAVIWLGEPLGPVKLVGAGMVLAGVALTRR
jgi:drug/metabolite transporter (DMT)-like permease